MVLLKIRSFLMVNIDYLVMTMIMKTRKKMRKKRTSSRVVLNYRESRNQGHVDSGHRTRMALLLMNIGSRVVLK